MFNLFNLKSYFKKFEKCETIVYEICVGNNSMDIVE